jgi:hypothetical protein
MTQYYFRDAQPRRLPPLPVEFTRLELEIAKDYLLNNKTKNEVVSHFNISFNCLNGIMNKVSLAERENKMGSKACKNYADLFRRLQASDSA